MHLSSKMAATSNMAAIMRRASFHLQPKISATTNRNYSHFRPVYSLAAASASAKTERNRHSCIQKSYDQVRWANTSSGIYAPSTMATHINRRMIKGNCESHLNVFEGSEHLPSLPVSNYNTVLDKLKESISPVAMNSAEFVRTLQLIDDFSQSAAPKLDLLLRRKAEQTKNWMTEDWWTQETYLKSRKPLVINQNPAMSYPTFPFEVDNQRALVNVISQIVSGIIEFKFALIHGYNPEATNADNECRLDANICYNQYQNIFGSTRLPGEQVDSIRVDTESMATDSTRPFTIVISHRGKFFEVQLNNIEDEMSRIDKLTGILDKIIGSQNVATADDFESTNEQEVLVGPGVLTATDRDSWSSSFKLLDSDSIDSIQNAQFVVCVDTIPTNPDKFLGPLLTDPVGSESHSAALGRQILHGDNTNVGNRWFDKTLQLIVVADNKAERLLGAGINYEHTLSEGTIITKLIEYSYDRAVQRNRDASKANFFAKQQLHSQQPTVFRQLRMFDENNIATLAEHLKVAKLEFTAHVNQFDLSHLAYKRYGSNSIKSWNFSPDSWFQVALQSAYYNLHKRLGPCYESASTRRFAYGRTETIRSLTKDVANFCFEPKYETMQSAIKSHKSYAVSACHGDAIDRVLMGYKLIFNELRNNAWSWGLPRDELIQSSTKLVSDESSDGQGFELEDLFTEDELGTIIAFFNNELIRRSTQFALSTSQVPSIHPDICMSYGPILADGYGCCYNITGQQISAAITANSSNQSFSCEVHELNDSLKSSLDRMRDIVEEQRSKSNK